MANAPKILFLVTEDWYFYSHRLPIARAARDAGCEVLVASRARSFGDKITREGFKLIPIRLQRTGKNPFSEIFSLFEIIRIYHREKPILAHHVAMKPVIYGSIAASLTGTPVTINAMAGLGFVFTSDRWLARFLKPLVQFFFRILLNRSDNKVIVQNPDDRRVLTETVGLSESRITVIRGSGVELQHFRPTPEPIGIVTVTLVSRMLWDKGVSEFVEAARLLKEGGVEFRAVLVGDPDPENPASISEEQLQVWQSLGIVECWGSLEDIPSVWARSHIAVLPSYREGLPKSLLEAAACSRPIIASDVPGCREIVCHNKNGLLVQVRNPGALAEAMKTLISNKELRYSMGAKGRVLVEQNFSDEVVVRDTLSLYKKLLGNKWPKSKSPIL